MALNSELKTSNLVSADSSELADIHDKVMEAYYGKMGQKFMEDTQHRIHWICEQVIGENILDVGCSQGIVPILLAREGINVVGVDTSSRAIEEAKTYLAKEPKHVKSRVTYINDDFLSCALENRQFDTVVMSEVLEHLVQPARFTEAAAKILNPGNRLIITVPFGINDFIDHKHTFYFLEPYQLISDWFDLESVEILGNWIGIVGTRKAKLSKQHKRLLETDVDKLESAFFALERALRDELASKRLLLDDVNKKYRLTTEQVANLKREVENHRLRADAATTSLNEMQLRTDQERNLLEMKLAQTKEESVKQNKSIFELEKQVIRLETELSSQRERLDASNQKYRLSTEQISTLKERIAEQNANVQSATKSQNESRLLLSQTQARLDDERKTSHDMGKQLVRLETELKSIYERLDSERTQQQDEMVDLNATHESELSQIRKALNEANEKYSDLTGTVVPRLKSKLEKQVDVSRETHLKLMELGRQLEKERHRRISAEQQVSKARATLSFQLGYLLIHSTKSFRKFVRLPADLWRLRIKASSRRRKVQIRELPRVSSSVQKTKSSTIQDVVSGNSADNGGVLKNTAVSVPKLQLTKPLAETKVACIMDDFTFHSYKDECVLMPLTPEYWESELEEFGPELLFIESAWRGKDEKWGNKVGHMSQEVQGVIGWCREHGIPSVFWNKEDPVHFETFLNTAMLFDYVFTTDIDCIHRYKAALGHERVYLLPFAAQPTIHNPIEKFDRKDAFCFAGAYYVRYPERTRDLESFITELPDFRPVEIYDRNYGKDDPNYQFPSEYKPYIVGTLPFDEIDKAYKGYRYAINLNSIKQSQSMFARRVYELMASNTLTISNFSRGLRFLFGDLVVATDNGGEVVRKLEALEGLGGRERKLRLLALRKVLTEHTYEHRLAYVASKVSGKDHVIQSPTITVLAHAKTQSDATTVIGHFERQSYEHVQLKLVGPNKLKPYVANNSKITFIDHKKAKSLIIGDLADKADFIAFMLPEDYYGKNYLMDIALANKYSAASLIGKNAHYVMENNKSILLNEHSAYKPCTQLPARCAAVRPKTIAPHMLMDWMENLPDKMLELSDGLAIDEFNYCREGGGASELSIVSEQVDDLDGVTTGLPLNAFLAKAEQIKPEEKTEEEGDWLTGKAFFADFTKKPSKDINLELQGDEWLVSSKLPDGKHEYLYGSVDHSLAELGFSDKVRLYLDVTLGLNIQLVVFFLDANKQRISNTIMYPNRNQETEIPVGTDWVRFGLRLYADGHAAINGLVLGHRNLQPPEMVTQSKYLILTNHYPSYENIYRNGFVHSRVLAYKERGVRADVFRFRPDESVSYHEYQDVDVLTGSSEVLTQMLGSGQYTQVLVHFLDQGMWEVLEKYIDSIKVTVWIHGSEIQPYHRRKCLYRSEEEKKSAVKRSDALMSFWRGLLRSMPINLRLVFVSSYSAETVMADLDISLPESQYVIINNPINTEIFRYSPKPIEQRTKILSIRPYTSAIYANDLTVKAILYLSEMEFFNKLEFTLVGDGPLFNATVEPLTHFGNVTILQSFLTHAEIAELHKHHGVFLVPTRMDSQGVSRDEAMASGLVPVTNSVAAIPEFVDSGCGILADAEDAKGLGDGIRDLYLMPDKFTSLSKAAALRIKQERDLISIISEELSIITE